jgi:para-aminobenzoate synthetase
MEIKLRLLERLISSETETLGIYERLYRGRPNSFWLDTSTLRDSHGWSFMGAMEGPRDHFLTVKDGTVATTTRDGATTIREVPSVWQHLGENLGRYQLEGETQSPFKGGYVGYLGYGLKTSAIAVAHAAERVPDLALLFCSRWIAIDHISGRVFACAACTDDDRDQVESWMTSVKSAVELAWAPMSVKAGLAQVTDAELSAILRDTALETRGQYEDKVRECIDRIKDGESYEICLTTGFEGPALKDPFAVYRTLRSVNPAPYAAYLEFGEVQVLSSSPERFLRVSPERLVETKPIKGTALRLENPEEDALAAAKLAADPKMRAENMMIVDLLRNDLNRMCEVGTVKVDSLMHVETYQTVHQLVSTISGRLAVGCTPLDVIESCFPGGSMTGAPKLRTMEIISDLEQHARGVYAGVLGFLSLDGYTDLSIVIRTIVNDPKRWFIGAGGAVLINSDPAAEYWEMISKAAPSVTAVLIAGGNGYQGDARS